MSFPYWSTCHYTQQYHPQNIAAVGQLDLNCLMRAVQAIHQQAADILVQSVVKPLNVVHSKTLSTLLNKLKNCRFVKQSGVRIFPLQAMGPIIRQATGPGGSPLQPGPL